MKSIDVDSMIKQAENLAKTGSLRESLEEFLVLEKKTRQAEDLISNSKVILTTIQSCFDSGEFDLLNECIVSFSKKHGLLRQSISKMVVEAVSYVDQINEPGEKLKLLNTLRTVTEGKIFLEIERARITRVLAGIKEESGDIVEALDLLSELQVETFSSMGKQEKTEFFLEQMRLAIMNKDYTRVYITSKNISHKVLSNEDNADLKLRYYDIMIQRALYEKEFLEVCKCYLQIYNTDKILKDNTMWPDILKNCVIFVILSAYCSEQHDLLHRLYQESNLLKIPRYRQLIKCFITSDIIRWKDLKENYSSILKETPHLNPSNPNSDFYWKELRKRVVEHSMCAIAKAYECINIGRFALLLDLNVNEAEEMLSNLVVNKTIYARVDRPLGIINFQMPKSTNDMLNEWSHNIQSVLNLIVKTNHLITKEEMVHNAVKMKQ